MCPDRYVSGTSIRKVSSGHKSCILFSRPWAPTRLPDSEIPWDSFFSPYKFEDSFINWPRRYISVCPCCRHTVYCTCTYYNCLPEDKASGSNRVPEEDIVNVEIKFSFKGAFCWFRSRDIVNIIPLHGTLKFKKLMVTFFSKNKKYKCSPDSESDSLLHISTCTSDFCFSCEHANIFISNNAIISGTEHSSVTVTVMTLATSLGCQSLVSLEAEIIPFS